MIQVWLGTLMATVLAVAAVMLALGLGLLVGRRAPRGSCGHGPGGDCMCDSPARPCQRLEKQA